MDKRETRDIIASAFAVFGFWQYAITEHTTANLFITLFAVVTSLVLFITNPKETKTN